MKQGMDVAQLMAMVQVFQELQKNPALQALAALAGGTVPKAQPRPKVQRPPKARPEPRVLSAEAAAVANELLLAEGVVGSTALFQGTYTNSKGYHSLKTFRVVEPWTSAAGEQGIVGRLCLPDGTPVPERSYTDKHGKAAVDDQKRCLVLAAFSNLKRLV
jgi:hypothetical protein